MPRDRTNDFAEELSMLRISAAITVLTLMGTGVIGVSAASADSWGCSYEKCLVACGKAGGKYCTSYCDKELKDKQLSKICK
jgi:hypothetical protein